MAPQPEVTPILKKKRKKSKTPMRSCDELFSRVIRSRGACEVFGCTNLELQCAHGFSRGYRAVRWDERNAFCLCKAHHWYFTPRPLQWEDWMRDRMGDALYDEMRQAALTGRNPKLPEVLAALRIRAVELGVAA